MISPKTTTTRARIPTQTPSPICRMSKVKESFVSSLESGAWTFGVAPDERWGYAEVALALGMADDCDGVEGGSLKTEVMYIHIFYMMKNVILYCKTYSCL